MSERVESVQESEELAPQQELQGAGGPGKQHVVNASEPGRPIVKEAPRKQSLIFDSRTRYYGFRNTRRMNVLKLCTALFVLMGFLGMTALVVGIGTAVVWFFLFVITISLISHYNAAWFGFMKKCFLAGGFLIVGSIVLKFLVELVFAGMELLELKTNPENAEKYLKVRRASFKIGLINLVLCLTVFGVGWFAFAKGIGKNAETVILVITVIVAFVTSKIALQRIYRKVSGEIIEIRLERKANRAK